MQDPGAENLFAPPGGSVFDTVAGRDGPPMMRMFIIQGAFESVKKFRRCTDRGKMLIVLLVSAVFIIGDMKNFTLTRTDNIYSQVNLLRNADYEEIDTALTQYNSCMDFDSECKDISRKGKIYKLSPEDVSNIFEVHDACNHYKMYL